MSLTNPNTVITEQRLNDFYKGILPYLGGMPEVLANKFSKGDMYSTDEKMIGQWTNGKPLYQKTYSTSVNIGSATTVDIPIITDFEYVDVIRCEVIRSSDSAHYILPNSGCNVIIMSSKNLRLNTASGVSYSGTLIFTIQYTKTTDTAISIGDDTDYSTEEKIVGTWIDGKPIYQKTLVDTMPTCTTYGTTVSKYVAIEDSVDSCIKLDVTMYRSDSASYVPLPSFVQSAKDAVYGARTSLLTNAASSNANTVQIANANKDFNGMTCYITIQYTKTT